MSTLLNPIPYHLLAYGTFLGSQLYQVRLHPILPKTLLFQVLSLTETCCYIVQSFINTKICYRSLPPQPFHNLNKRLWPVYFRCQLGLALLTVATKPGGWLPPANLSNVLLGVACTMAGLNWYTYGPRTSDAMVERANVLKGIHSSCQALGERYTCTDARQRSTPKTQLEAAAKKKPSRSQKRSKRRFRAIMPCRSIST